MTIRHFDTFLFSKGTLIVAMACIMAAEVRGRGPTTVDSLKAMVDLIPRLAPGMVVQLADGKYVTANPISIERKRGTSEAPLVLRAKHRGRAVIGGAAGFVVKDCEHLLLEGFEFVHDSDQPAVLLDNCRHVRVTRNTFRLIEPAKPRHMEHWISVIGDRSGHNRIDHNLFGRKANSGSHVFIRGDDSALVGSMHDRIDHNHFRDVIYAEGRNGHETIRTGSNDLGASGRSTFSTIEHNRLEHCSGEEEIISLKSSDNIVRHNTFLNCRGAICLRLGNRNEVSGNFVLNPGGGPDHGGVKLYGFDHRVFNNYFLGLTGTRHVAPLALIPGTLDTPTTPNIGKNYDDLTSVPPTRVWIAFNTWIDCAPLQFGFPKIDVVRKYVPVECVFVNNLVAHTRVLPAPLLDLGVVRSLRAHDNIGYSRENLPHAQWTRSFRWEDPRLRTEGHGLWLLTGASPAIDVAVDGSGAIDDVFGRQRTDRRDVGAEEFSNEAILHWPLTTSDVGPDAPSD